MSYETVVGLEVHVELNTKTKIFCSCPNAFGGEENTHCCPVCLGLPGSLPVINGSVVDYAVKAGFALNCTVNATSQMDRKNYHYPDMTKGYQISQRNVPICQRGRFELVDEDGAPFAVGITEIHMEEDAGKLVHVAGRPYSRADYNRASVPLIEIVTEPDMRSAAQARIFLSTLRETLLALGISDCRMEEGSMRCDVNVSVRRAGEGLGTRTEVKNVNSFRSVVRAIEYESKRQTKRLENGETVTQQTMHWDDDAGRTTPMRDKENSHDYRYFPEPDLPPVVVDAGRLALLKASLPELPAARQQRYIALGIPKNDAWLIAVTPWMAALLDQALYEDADARIAANQIIGPLAALWNEPASSGETLRFSGIAFAQFVTLIAHNRVNSSGSKTLLEQMVRTGRPVDEIVSDFNLLQLEDADELEKVAREVVAENPGAVKDYLSGKEKALTSLQGAAMKKTKGKANPVLMKELLLKVIELLPR
jgi:aspartyl-tRNA(Asn)/glutamyl-tRNA(Gln) amidotransferase subunit B